MHTRVSTTAAISPLPKPSVNVTWKERLDGPPVAVVTWHRVPDHISPFAVLGYKLNWGAPGTVTHSGLVSLGHSVLLYEIHGLSLESDIEIAVWAYNIIADGTPARKVLKAYNCKDGIDWMHLLYMYM